MISGMDKQAGFFEEYVYGSMIPKEHILVKIREKIDFSFIEEETRDLYSGTMGRPAYPAELMFRMMFLEYYYNHSDVEISEMCRYNALYKYFAGLKIDGEIPDDTSLVVFRKRLGAERFERIFNRIIKECEKAGLLEGKRKLVDASKIVADVAIPNTVNLLRQGRKVLIRQILGERRKDFRRLAKKYYTREKEYQKPDEKKLEEELRKSREFLEEIDGKYSERVQKNVEAMRGIVRGQKRDRVVSFSDVDARFGQTKKEKESGFCGYKVHIAEDESEIVTSVDLLKGNQSEGEHLPELLDKEEEKGVKSKAVVGDGGYDNGNNYKEIKDRRMKAYITFNQRSRRKWKGFRYKRKQDKVECPAGKRSIGNIRQEKGNLYYFSVRDCGNCERKKECLKEGEDRARVFVRGEYIHMKERPYKIAMKLRKMIERKFGEAKRWHNMARARYRGQWRVKIQALMTFFVINIKRIVRLLEEKGMSTRCMEPGLGRAGP